MRRAAKIALCLLLGLITALAVTAAIGWFMPFRNTRGYSAKFEGKPEWRFVERMEMFGASTYHALGWVYPSQPVTRSAPEIRDSFHSATWKEATLGFHAYSVGGPDSTALLMEWGWPFRCLWGAADSHRPSSLDRSFGLYVYIRHISPNTTYSRVIPYAPIPRGLILNSIVWGLPWWLALFGFREMRKWRRLRRHHCPACNYNLAGLAPSSPCPECGKTTRTSS